MIKDFPQGIKLRPPVEMLSGTLNAPDTFAFVTLHLRLPTILTKTIDSLTRFLHALDSRGGGTGPQLMEMQGREIVKALVQLRYELQHDRPFAELQHDICGRGERDAWNECIQDFRVQGIDTWFKAPWLFSECYIYRRIADAFYAPGSEGVASWRDHDWFGEQKLESFWGSFESICKAGSLLDKSLGLPSRDYQLAAEFETFVLASLWGNQMDLSMHAGKSKADIADSLHVDHSAAAKTHLIVNDIGRAWLHLQACSIPKDKRIVHIVLDNSAAELFNDLCLADWLVSRELVSRVVLHGKAFPWFVSDVTSRDIPSLLACLREGFAKISDSSVKKAMQAVVNRWTAHLDNGKWTAEFHPFFTTHYPYAYMREVAPTLYETMCQEESCLWIFKGDLNYRKLVQDCNWPHPFTVAFDETLGRLAASVDKERPPLLALRTTKADVISGLPAGAAERLDKLEGKNIKDSGWLVTGKYAVAQFN